MALIETITDSSKLFHDLKQTSSYNNVFSYEGANALQEYLDQLSDDIGEDIEWDPIAWAVSYTEYDDFETFKSDNGWTDAEGTHDGYEGIDSLEELQNHTTVIEFDGGIIVEDF